MMLGNACFRVSTIAIIVIGIIFYCPFMSSVEILSVLQSPARAVPHPQSFFVHSGPQTALSYILTITQV